ncbi:MAG: ABC transporter substrate-binding protein [Syntrophomonadaceae bacterium]|mgnify:FL=1|jgi:glycine betaine/proline transport system substrate-binding protein|nr:ABC transporter substrate-binding protein [Syntrophomonadaceae bacterium]HQD91004.1 ABC transporter substrate-binding protein [Syntrophomonadaceae bacterium]
MITIKNELGKKTAKWLLLLVLLIFGLSAVGCGGSNSGSKDDDTTNGSDKPKLVMADITWDSVQVHNRVVGFILQHGYGYPEPEYTFGDTMPLLQGMARGDVDITMEVWQDNYAEPWNEIVKSGSVIDLGSIYPDAPQGWYIPTYMIKGDPERGIEPMAPDLKSVFDLPRYWELFKDPEVPTKGRFHNSPPGWMVTDINEAKFKTYGLEETFNLFSTGSDSALSASMVSAYEKGEAWVGYNWEPNWVMGQLDMTMLEEPPYDPEVYNDPDNRGCAYPAAQVLKGVHVDVQTSAPEAFDLVSKYETTLEQNNDFLSYMSENNVDTQAAAIYFLKTYPEIWKAWVPEDVAQKVEQALEEVN